MFSDRAHIKRLYDEISRKARMIVFYAESSIYYLYFEAFIKYILDSSEYCICYITSDPKDPVFELESERFKVFYISNVMLASVTVSLDSKVFVLTMTDLDRFHIKRSVHEVNHIYVFHAVLSTHMSYSKGAFNHYDTIFCVGPHHLEEIRRTEKLYGLKKKQLVEVGYPLLEKMYKEHNTFEQAIHPASDSPALVLIAPSWGRGNIIESCLDKLVPILLGSGFKVVLRPHPETFKRNKRKIKAICDRYGSNEHFQLETALTSVQNFHAADILITDWSGIAFEYAFGTERPVLFINTPPKVHNSEYKKIDLEPVEIKLRNEIGVSLNVEDIDKITRVIENLITNRFQYKDKIAELRSSYIFNWGSSAGVGAEYILQYINNQVIE